MKLYYVANARMPNEKAHGIQIAKMCEAFIEQGVELTLVLPSRGTPTKTIQEFYELRVPVPTVYLRVPDWYLSPSGFLLSSLYFMCAYRTFFREKRHMGEDFTIYSVDMDTFSYAFLPCFALTTVEMHSPKNRTFLNRFFFSRVDQVIATNTLIGKNIQETFHVSPEKIFIAPNGHDPISANPLSKEDARRMLGLPLNARIALYVGRFLPWKGMEILPKALADMPENHACYVVGGKTEELERLTKVRVPKSLRVMGEKDSHEISTWLVASDVGIVLGTKENESSYRYTSPMKVFEYMGAELPIVASRTPALEDILSDTEAFFYAPDDSQSLRQTVLHALDNQPEARRRATSAYKKAQTFSWKNRAIAVLKLLETR